MDDDDGDFQLNLAPARVAVARPPVAPPRTRPQAPASSVAQTNLVVKQALVPATRDKSSAVSFSQPSLTQAQRHSSESNAQGSSKNQAPSTTASSSAATQVQRTEARVRFAPAEPRHAPVAEPHERALVPAQADRRPAEVQVEMKPFAQQPQVESSREQQRPVEREVESMGSRRNPLKTGPHKTAIIVPVPSSVSASSVPAPAERSCGFRIVEAEDRDTYGEGGLFDGHDGKSGAAAFTSMGLDSRLVDKLTTAPGAGQSAGAHAVNTAPIAGGAAVAAVSGVVRGHLRDGFGLARPTRVQRLVLPVALKGTSLVVKSETGSGKTLAFCLPVMHGLLQQHTAAALTRAGATRALIISPTRELCAQIFGVLSRLCQPFPFLVPSLLVGGEKRKSEKARLRKGCTVVVATPGRLLDHLRMTEAFACDNQSVRWLVLDEADRLLDMGFGAQVQAIVDELGKRGRKQAGGGGASTGSRDPSLLPRQTLLVSATVSSAVRELAQSVLASDAVFIDASAAGAAKEAKAAEKGAEKGKKRIRGEEDGDEGGNEDMEGVKPAPEAVMYSAPKTLTQTAMLVPLKWRLVTLLGVIVQAVRRARAMAAKAAAKRAGAGGSAAHEPAFKAILFLSSTHSVDFHAALLALVLPGLLGRGKPVSGSSDSAPALVHRRDAFPVYRLHGNVAQADRTGVYRSFSAADSGLLVATDVAARGLDLPAVDMIVQADAPSETGEYVHRIGRTARRGAKGAAVLILQPHEAPFLDLLKAAGMAVTQVDTTPPLSSLAELRIPLDLAAHPDAKTSLVDSAHGADGTGRKGRDKEKAKEGARRGAAGGGPSGGLNLQALMEADPDDAEAAAAAYFNKRQAESLDDGAGAGGDGGSGREMAGFDPASGAPMRLLNMIRFADDVRRKQHRPGGGSTGLPVAGVGPDLVRLAEAYAVAWQYWLEEVVLHRSVLVAASTGGAKPAPVPVSASEGDGAPALLDPANRPSPLLSVARQAFTSFVRAYATHEKAVRHIFHPRSLHLGHSAKAFGLREQPGVASHEAGKEARGRAEEEAAAVEARENHGYVVEDDLADGRHGSNGTKGKKRPHPGSGPHASSQSRAYAGNEGEAGASKAQAYAHKKSRLHFVAGAEDDEDRPAQSRGEVSFDGGAGGGQHGYASGGAGSGVGRGYGDPSGAGRPKKKAKTSRAVSEFDS